MPRRLAYFAYYLRRLDRARLAAFMAYLQREKGWSRRGQWARILRDSLRYNISILEYYQFRFFELSSEEKAKWAGTGTMYEFQRRANPPGAREILEDKCRFHEAYRDFFRHAVYTREALAAQPGLAEQVLQRHDRLVFKPARGNCGVGIAFVAAAELSAADLVPFMTRNGYDLVEEGICQHPEMMRLSPAGVNTVRIFTALDAQDQCHILGCRLRISVDSEVDNMAAGNLAAPVDEDTGRVTGPGVYSDITRAPEPVHPVTGTPIEGFQIPFWPETLALARAASLAHRQNRSIGWDIVITPDGPGLIEGNHDWCKLVWQLPVGQGLKRRLEAFA
ncbi:MAG: hexapeptide transferase [Rhodobacteraceae bacterium]|nr:MAG: hexapeptide transferase [Paracoccaceae bacterium]